MLGRIDKAKACLERAIEVFREIDRPSSELVKRIQLGGVLGSFGDRKAAQQQLGNAATLAEKIGDRPQLAAAQRTLGGFLHEWGKREEGWTRLDLALKLDEELGNQDGKAATLDLMGHAALNEHRFDDAKQMLEGSLAATQHGLTSQTLLTQCRLAAACKGMGNEEQARKHATTAEHLLEEIEKVSPVSGPEIHYRLSALTESEERQKQHLTMAESLLSTRAASIRNGGYREHFLTQSGHNPKILEEAKRTLEDSGDEEE